MELNTRRPRRNRRTAVIRDLVRETVVSPADLIYPLFIKDGKNSAEPIASMPGISRFSLDLAIAEMKECYDLGVRAFALFPVIADELKDSRASESTNPDGLYLRAIREMKQALPEAVLMTDVAMDPYSSDGHDGLVENGQIINDATLEILANMAVAQAAAGADLVGPSDMMDGRIGYIRQALDQQGHTGTGIMAYTAKYASGFYGPFRDALSSAPRFGDKKTYQMDPANSREALVEAQLDAAEGADMLMVKPGLPYLDIIQLLSQTTDLPIAAYNVSGEYAMIKAAAANGWLDNDRCMVESLTSLKRAGAKIILTYFAKEFAQLVQR